ncbi:MAG: hypothetical protein QOD99_3056 [Chthoniobacter sp.]|jgi:hypothetical protein|nr:hypothetical protein [Chthoniobacter sp.]
MEQLVIALVVGLVALIKYLASGSGESEPDATKNTPSAFGPMKRGDDEAERMRRFMEALGVPPSTRPPPRAQRRLKTREEILREQRELPVPQLQIPRKRIARIEVPPPTPVPSLPEPEPVAVLPPAYEPPPPVALAMPVAPDEPPPVDSQPAVRKLLRSGMTLRTAVILREILGPPRGLQSML